MFPNKIITAFLLTLTFGLTVQAQSLKNDFSKPVIGGYISNRIESVNTFWIESKDEVIVIDLQRSLTKARETLGEVKKLNKPVVAILITHPHPDHIAGIGLFKEAFPNADVYASQNTIDEIKNDTNKFISYTKQLYVDDYPDKVFVPNKVLKTSGTLNLAGVQIEYAELGASESKAATVYYVPSAQALFVGDLVIHQMIPFLLEERSEVWLKQLAAMSNQYPNAKLVYSGHGFPGGAKALLDEQMAYLNDVRALVKTEIKAGQWNGKKLNDAAKKRVAAEIGAKYSHYIEAAAIPNILEANAEAVAAELVKLKDIKGANK